jgi:RND family efflux transporter MFP subunit
VKSKTIRARIAQYLPVFLIALIGGAVTIVLIAGKEETSLSGISRPALSVETLEVQNADYRVQVPGWGFVEPRETIDIRTEIEGRVTYVSHRVFAGARVRRGDHLFSLDERSYRNTLAEAMATLEQAQQALAIEKGRQIIAQSEWNLLEASQWQGVRNEALALRKPQLKEREAALKMAFARKNQAALDVERARIAAPCDGVILYEELAEGQILDTSSSTLRIACTDCYRLKAMFASEYSLGTAAEAVKIDIGPNRYAANIKAVLPNIHPETRQKQALVEFRGAHVSLNAYAAVILPGRQFHNIVVLPREALRPGNTVWTFSESSTLEIRPVTVLARDMVNVVIGEGITKGEHVILSHIAGPLQGMPLRKRAPQTEDPRPITNGEQQR